jgi:hypothetical protein
MQVAWVSALSFSKCSCNSDSSEQVFVFFQGIVYFQNGIIGMYILQQIALP